MLGNEPPHTRQNGNEPAEKMLLLLDPARTGAGVFGALVGVLVGSEPEFLVSDETDGILLNDGAMLLLGVKDCDGVLPSGLLEMPEGLPDGTRDGTVDVPVFSTISTGSTVSAIGGMDADTDTEGVADIDEESSLLPSRRTVGLVLTDPSLMVVDGSVETEGAVVTTGDSDGTSLPPFEGMMDNVGTLGTAVGNRNVSCNCGISVGIDDAPGSSDGIDDGDTEAAALGTTVGLRNTTC